MGSGFAEAPLAVFTTLAPMGACAFVLLALAFSKNSFTEEQVAKIDKMTIIPLVVMLVGFIGAFFHLSNPAAALGAIAGLGRSPLTNEVAIGSVTLVAGIVYWLLARSGKLEMGARKGFLVVVAVLSVVFAAFCGFAYTLHTVPSWNTPWTVVQMVGYGLLGGSAMGALTLRAAGVELLGQETFLQGVIGLAVALVGFGGQIVTAGSVSNIWGTAASQVPAIWMLFAVLAVCAVAVVAIERMGGKKPVAVGMAGVACCLAAVGIFIARIGFYGLYMGVAL
jgi:anaerobic dimethyl sulfoxide reductase subunit C (anchor subunit)/Tat-targeted selenate reductase subunit YnfH